MLYKFLKNIAPIAAMAVSVGLAGCNFSFASDGVPLAELDQSGEAPDELALASGDNVVITTGETFAIKVEGDEKDVAEMRFSLDGRTLGISRESDSWGDGKSTTVRVTMPAPREIDMAGSGRVETNGLAERAEINIAGSGNVAANSIRAKELEVSIAGSGHFTGSGTAERLEISLLGSGDARLDDLKADKADISIAGSGGASFMSDGTVEASIAGSGDIAVTGRASCTVNAVGSGTLNCKPGTNAEANGMASAEADE